MDGILVTAMEKGYWLHISNTNLCPSSVLDRLNPLLEENGKLILTECSAAGTMGNMTGPKIVQVHKNFRILLSINPEMGEVSRAMRNRCIEINLILSVELQSFESADMQDLELLHSSSIRAVALSNAVAVAHTTEQKNLDKRGDEKLTLSDLHESGSSRSDLVRRGWCFVKAVQKSFEMTQDFREGQSIKSISETMNASFRGSPTRIYSSSQPSFVLHYARYERRTSFSLKYTSVGLH